MIFKALAGAIFAVALVGLGAARTEAGTINIVGFGDSLMAGYELPPEEAFAAQLERLLKARGHDVVITNAGAGTSDEENLAAAVAVLREGASVEVAQTSNPGELDGVLHRAGGRTIVVAGGDGSMHAVVAALYKRQELADARRQPSREQARAARKLERAPRLAPAQP